MTVTIVDYGLGNIQAFHHIYKRLRIPVNVASTAAELAGASKLILPGVGSFDWAMHRLNSSGMRNVLDELVLGEGVPVLGICVGMQIMARSSDEGESQGLNWIDGKICHLNNLMVNQGLILPHMGWNDVSPIIAQPLFSEIVHPRFYFLHSYYFIPSQRSEALSTTVYGDNFTSAVCRNRIYGVQFHPEKSHAWGIQLLKNFALS